jgi:hypothetical protein
MPSEKSSGSYRTAPISGFALLGFVSRNTATLLTSLHSGGNSKFPRAHRGSIVCLKMKVMKVAPAGPKLAVEGNSKLVWGRIKDACPHLAPGGQRLSIEASGWGRKSSLAS